MAPQFQPGGNATIEAAQLANQNAQQPTTSQSHSAQQQQQSPSASQQPPNQTPLQFVSFVILTISELRIINSLFLFLTATLVFKKSSKKMSIQQTFKILKG